MSKVEARFSHTRERRDQIGLTGSSSLSIDLESLILTRHQQQDYPKAEDPPMIDT